MERTLPHGVALGLALIGAAAAAQTPSERGAAPAATAIAHDLVLLTCNGKHFEPLGVPFVDPIERLPSVS